MDLITLLAAEGEKHEGLELGLILAIPLIVTFIVLRVTKTWIDNGGPRWSSWLSLLPLLVGVALAYPAFRDISTDSYRDFHMVTDRSVMLHYASFFAPIGAIVILVGILLYGNYRRKLEG
jgi:hypothetical protein